MVVGILAAIPLTLPYRAAQPVRVSLASLPWRRGLAWAAALGVLAAVGSVAYRAARVTVWVSEVPVTIVPTRDEAGQVNSYRRSVTTRRAVVGTYAQVFDRLGRPALREAPEFRP